MELDLKALRTYAFADLASKRASARSSKLRRSRQSIVVVATGYLSLIFVVYAWAGRETTTEFQERILDVYDKYSPKRFGIEANGMQVLFGDLVYAEAKLRFDGKIGIFPFYQPTNVEKDYRIRTGLEPVINAGRLILLESQVELISEIRGFPTARRKDLVDTLETAIRLAPKPTTAREYSSEIEAYADYLRNSGCKPHLIRDMVNRYETELKSSGVSVNIN